MRGMVRHVSGYCGLTGSPRYSPRCSIIGVASGSMCFNAGSACRAHANLATSPSPSSLYGFPRTIVIGVPTREQGENMICAVRGPSRE